MSAMKKLSLIFTTTFLLIVIVSSATVWRVNNRPNVDADFATLQAAIDGASATDTIYLEGSPFSYGGGSFFKPLTVIGAGYWLNENDQTQAYKESSKVGILNFYNGSQGSLIEGLVISIAGNYGGNSVYIDTHNITIRRNKITATGYYGGYNAIGIRVNNVGNSIIIEQNWIEPNNTATDATGYAIFTNYYLINSTISNNVFHCDTTGKAIFISVVNEAASCIISNNVIMGEMNTSYSSHFNNIILWGDYTPGSGDINSNNLCNATQYPNLNSNQQNVDMTTVFEDYSTYIDNGYILAIGSPANGAGIGGDDCGAFGTNDPYVLSGMPPIPAIYEVEMTQSIGTSTLPVTVKAMSHK